MERLTFEGNFCEIAKCLETPGGTFCESGTCSQRKIWERLKAYEDTGLEPAQILYMASQINATVEIINNQQEQAMERLRIFSRALDTYGAEAQTRMVFEEFAELQKELCKHARGKDNRMEVAEEIADVFNVLDQMIILYDCGDEVAAFRKEKLLRLAEKLEEGTE